MHVEISSKQICSYVYWEPNECLYNTMAIRFNARKRQTNFYSFYFFAQKCADTKPTVG